MENTKVYLSPEVETLEMSPENIICRSDNVDCECQVGNPFSDNPDEETW